MMASGATRLRHRATATDYSRRLPPEMLHSALDYLPQPDVLHAAHVSRRWRSVATGHPHFYRSIRLITEEHNFFSSWNGREAFHRALLEAQGDTVRLQIVFEVKNSCSSTNKEKKDDVRSFIENETIPLISAVIPLAKKLNLVFSDHMRGRVFDMLRRPAPYLENFALQFVDLRYDYDDDDDDDDELSESDSGSDASDDCTDDDEESADTADEYSIPPDLFRANAPRLDSVSFSGVRLGQRAVPAFACAKSVRLGYRMLIRCLDLPTLFPAMLHLSLELYESSIPQGGLTGHALKLPCALASLHIESYDRQTVLAVLDVLDIRKIPRFRLFSEDQTFDWLPFVQDLSVPLEVRIGFSTKCGRWAVDTYVADITTSIISSNGLVRTFCCGDYDAETWGSREHWQQFDAFSCLSPAQKSIEKLYILHEHLPAMFRISARLDALRLLELNMDEYRSPFWGTQDSNDYPIPDTDTDTVVCPALETLILRTTYSHRTISPYQVLYFGRALGSLQRTEEERPRLVLCGVELSGALHLDVFREVVTQPLLVPKLHPRDAGNAWPLECTYDDEEEI